MSTSGDWADPAMPSGGQPAGGASGAGQRNWINVAVAGGLVLVAVLLGAIIYLVATTDGGDDSGADAQSTGTGTDAPDSVTEGDGATPNDDTLPIESLEVGDCFSHPDGEVIQRIAIRDCRLAHDAEVYATLELDYPPDAPWRGDDVVRGWARDECLPLFEDFVGLSSEESDLEGGFFYPTIRSWETEHDRSVTCYLYEEGVQTTGTLEGAAR